MQITHSDTNQANLQIYRYIDSITCQVKENSTHKACHTNKILSSAIKLKWFIYIEDKPEIRGPFWLVLQMGLRLLSCFISMSEVMLEGMQQADIVQ